MKVLAPERVMRLSVVAPPDVDPTEEGTAVAASPTDAGAEVDPTEEGTAAVAPPIDVDAEVQGLDPSTAVRPARTRAQPSRYVPAFLVRERSAAYLHRLRMAAASSLFFHDDPFVLP
jgi:hypothetical protein